ncbi:hypothetical protein M405DRAFT_833050 [Rhizopogon salebrosus TDB-379]|nr:hypothetical protein M405DRAFT_833050 [Rhizopogon salebrosus TDB-379]
MRPTHVSNLHAILVTCTPLHPLATVHRYLPPARVTQCTHYHYPPASFRLLPEFHVPLANAESSKDTTNWYKIHSVAT